MKDQWNYDNKRRREEQIRLIRDGVENTSAKNSSWAVKSFKVSGTNTTPKRRSWKKKLATQTIVTIGLFIATSIVFQSSSMQVKPVEQFVTSAMTRDFNFSGMYAWYKTNLGGSPSIIPTFGRGSVWSNPTVGRVVLPFDDNRKGIVIRTKENEDVRSVMNGTIKFAGEKEGLGTTVVIKLDDGKEVWYGWLKDTKINADDKVNTGQKIANVTKTKGQSLLYFAVKDKGKFVNPQELISLE